MNTKIEPTYDVIVVGAGNGGMIAGAKTAKEGLKTLILEKNNTPGGCATSFVRGRFEFEPSLHELCCVGTAEHPDTVTNIFTDLGIKIDWHYEDTMFRAIVTGENGYDVRIKAGIEAFCDSMEAAVPGCRESVHALFDIISLDEEATKYNAKSNGKPNVLKMVLKYGDFLRAGSHSIKEVMDALGIPEKAQSIIGTYWSYLGVPMDELNAFHFLSMFKGYVIDYAALPPYRSHQLSVAILDRYLKNGGEIWYNSPVTKFLYDETGRVCGVEANGQKLYAKEVISNVIPNNVYNISDEKYVPKPAVKLANARSFGLSIITAYIGLDCTKEDLGITDYTIFISKTPDSRKQFEERKNGSFYIVNCLNAALPDCSPEGTSIFYFSIPCLGSDFPKDLQPQDYRKYKENIVRPYIEDFQKVMKVDLLSHIEEIEIATPATFARYINTPEGTIYGYATSGWDSVMARCTMDMKPYTIPGLSFCGGHASYGDGYSCSYISGFDTAKSVIAKIKEGK